MTSSLSATRVPSLRATALHPDPVRPLDPVRYAQTHAVFEAASDQRDRLCEWLVRALPPLVADIGTDGGADGHRALRVLGVGVGDGSVDAILASALAAHGRSVRYEGVEPHAASAARFVAALENLGRPGLTASASVCSFDDFHDEGAGGYDLVHFIHSLYYVTDLGAALDRALALLRPGGWLVALQSPRAPLSEIAASLTAQAGFAQWYAEALDAELRARGVSATRVIIDGKLEIGTVWSDPNGHGEQLLDFLAQVRTCDLGPAQREAVLDYLGELADPDHPTLVPHPVQAVLVRAPPRPADQGPG